MPCYPMEELLVHEYNSNTRIINVFIHLLSRITEAEYVLGTILKINDSERDKAMFITS